MERPEKITVLKKNDGYEIFFMDEMSGSSLGISISENGYLVLAEHFRTGAMEISSDELNNCSIPAVSKCDGNRENATVCVCQTAKYKNYIGICTNCGKPVYD